MPHQCLKCGEVFAEGSSIVLRGCPHCGGTRFFFTEKPLGKEEREQLIKTANQDIQSIVREVLSQKKGKALAGFLQERLIEEERGSSGQRPRSGAVAAPVIRKVRPKKRQKKVITRKPVLRGKQPRAAAGRYVPTLVVRAAQELKEQPEVVDIVAAGVYEIDVKSLLENSPVVVKRGGTYIVHLPSLFEKLEKKTR
jgi:predicted  nucleic acid-binding Zn-ribbon protein